MEEWPTIILSHISISSFQLVYSLEVEKMTKSIVILSLGTMKFENFACFVVGFPIFAMFHTREFSGLSFET